MVGEKYTNLRGATDPIYMRDEFTYGLCNDDQGWVDGWDNDMICDSAAGVPKRILNTFGLYDCALQFGSVHAEMQAVFCDGSVHAVSYTIGNDVWTSLCAINDGQAMPPID